MNPTSVSVNGEWISVLDARFDIAGIDRAAADETHVPGLRQLEPFTLSGIFGAVKRRMIITCEDGQTWEFDALIRDFKPNYGTRYGKPRTSVKLPRKWKKQWKKGAKLLPAVEYTTDIEAIP